MLLPSCVGCTRRQRGTARHRCGGSLVGTVAFAASTLALATSRCCRGSPLRLILIIDVGKSLTGSVADNKSRADVFNDQGGGKRRADIRLQTKAAPKIARPSAGLRAAQNKWSRGPSAPPPNVQIGCLITLG